MIEGFVKFKRKIFLEVFIKSIICGLSFGLVVFSIPYLLTKLELIVFELLYIILCSISSMILVFLLTFLVLKPSKMKIAKRLDKELALNEKVQTMVEYENESGFMVNYQRENTLGQLSNISIKKLTMRFSLVLVVFAILALSVCVTAFAIPSKEKQEDPTILPSDPIEPTDPIYEVDDWTKRAIQDLIVEVKKSTANQKLKDEYIKMLEKLLVELDLIETESELELEIKGIIASINLLLDLTNTNNEIHAILKESTVVCVDALATQINLLNPEQVGYALDGFKILIGNNASAIDELHSDFGKVLSEYPLSKEENLFKALNTFYLELYKCKNSENVLEAVENVIDNYSYSIISEITLQAENKRISDYVCNQLIIIFNIKEEDNSDITDEEPVTTPINPDEDDKLPEGNNSGGLGDGNVIFGSNDEFFDPEVGKTIYGDVITKYSATIINMFAEGKIPEEYREYYEKYFDILFGDLNKE